MSQKIKSTIQEKNDGTYYSVELLSIPRKGETISLYSHLDQSQGYDPQRRYTVLSVIHEIQDSHQSTQETNDTHQIKLIVEQTK